jgi:hypothetical protein
MNVRHIQSRFFAILLLLIAGIVLQSPFSAAKQTPESSFDVIIKISQLEKTLDIIDELVIADPSRPLASPTTLIRGMLQGTGWIDPDRTIVIGIEMRNSLPIGTALIPFRQANNDFQKAYQASAGPDYYILSCPPGQEVNISGALEAVLVNASKSKPVNSISAEFRVSDLLKKGESKIQEALQNLENMPVDETKEFAPKPQEIKNMLSNIIDTARQLELFIWGLDFNQKRITSFFEAKAEKETVLAELFAQNGSTMRLGHYRPQYQINFRSRSYDIGRAAEFIDSFLGDFYRCLGIDFSGMTAIWKSFTGEMAGGMSTDKAGAKFEMISVLKEGKTADDFLEAVYLPWIERYNQILTQILEKQFPGQSTQLFKRTADTTVAGHKVIGIKTQAPPLFFSADKHQTPGGTDFMKYEMRMTTVGNLFIMAPDDKRINELIRVAETFRESPAEGSLMTYDIDIAGYFNSVKEMLPGLPTGGISLPQTGRMTGCLDLKDGRAFGESSIMIDDVKKIIAHFKSMDSSIRPCVVGTEAENQITVEKENVEEIVQVTEKEIAVTEKDAVYWSNKGSLCAVYGNDKAAIEYFKKAIELEPRKSSPYYLLGVSYGEIGHYEEAISSINKALELEPEKAVYYYGRGRVYLLYSEKDRAMADLKLAAGLGNRDAQKYLENSELFLQ